MEKEETIEEATKNQEELSKKELYCLFSTMQKPHYRFSILPKDIFQFVLVNFFHQVSLVDRKEILKLHSGEEEPLKSEHEKIKKVEEYNRKIFDKPNAEKCVDIIKEINALMEEYATDLVVVKALHAIKLNLFKQSSKVFLDDQPNRPKGIERLAELYAFDAELAEKINALSVDTECPQCRYAGCRIYKVHSAVEVFFRPPEV